MLNKLLIFSIFLFCSYTSYADDRQATLAAIKKNGCDLETVDEAFKKDKEIVLAAVKNCGKAFKYADSSLRKDKEIVLASVKGYKGHAAAFEYADEALKKIKKWYWQQPKASFIFLNLLTTHYEKIKTL